MMTRNDLRNLAAMLAVTTSADVAFEPNIEQGDEFATVYVTCGKREDLNVASEAVGAALNVLGYSGRFHRVSGKTVWRTVVGQVGGCRGYLDGYRCGFDIRIA